MGLPLVRLYPFYPGQMGVAGSDVQRGLRWAPEGIVLYVDENHPNATANNDGTDPENPINSIQTAVTRLTNFATAFSSSLEGSVIVVAAESTPQESVIIPATAPKNCKLMGAGSGINSPAWTAATPTGVALTIRQEGWTVEGFLFRAGSGGTSIKLDWVPGSGYVGYRTVIQNNHFDGLWQGLYAIDLYGAPYDVVIQNNWFREYRRGDSSAYAIICTDSSTAEPYMCKILGNWFEENENHIGSLNNVRSFNASLIQGNTFNDGMSITATIMLDLRSNHGGRNMVVGNYFSGDYSNTGGYYDSTASVSNWVGNFAEDVLEAEVGDNSITVLPPAA
jgi:hypothetical protein